MESQFATISTLPAPFDSTTGCSKRVRLYATHGAMSSPPTRHADSVNRMPCFHCTRPPFLRVTRKAKGTARNGKRVMASARLNAARAIPNPMSAADRTRGRSQKRYDAHTANAIVSTYMLSDISISSLIQRCAYPAASNAAIHPAQSLPNSRRARVPSMNTAPAPNRVDARRCVS